MTLTIKCFGILAIVWAVATTAFGQNSCRGLMAPLRDNESLNYSKLVRFIQCNHFEKISDVLKGLPLRLRQRYLLVYSSHSRHRDATFELPRIILEDENAKIIIAAAGDPNQVNGDNLEIIENPDNGSDSQFHVIVFPENPTHTMSFNEHPHFCAGCHRDHLSPNWESYPLWPGAYGSGVGSLSESGHFKTFIETLNRQKQAEPDKASLNRYEALDGLIEGKIDIYDLESRNHTFSSDVGAFNSRRIISRVLSDPLYTKLEPAFAAAVHNCPNIETFFPAKIQSKLKMSLQEYAQSVEVDTLSHFRSELKTASQLTKNNYVEPVDWLFFFAVRKFIPVGYIMKYVMGVDPDDYSVTKDASVYNSHHTLGGLETQFEYLEGANPNCEALRTMSLKALQGI